MQGAKYCYIWAASNFLCVIFFYLFMPEMKGRYVFAAKFELNVELESMLTLSFLRSLEELDEIFAARVPARKFPGYQCQIVQEADRYTYINPFKSHQLVSRNADTCRC